LFSPLREFGKGDLKQKLTGRCQQDWRCVIVEDLVETPDQYRIAGGYFE